MTVTCPNCGAKWKTPDNDYIIFLEHSRKHEILCVHCNMNIEFILTRRCERKIDSKIINHLEAKILEYQILLSHYDNNEGEVQE